MDEAVKKNRATDIVLKLKVMDGKTVSNSMGIPDKRLFDGTNNLHAVQDPQTTLWYMRYDHGAVPEVFKQRFTAFQLLLEFARKHFERRNIEISEIID